MTRRNPLLVLALLSVLGGFVGQHGCGPSEDPVVPRRRAPNLIVIVIDTLRADMLSGPKGEPAEMPFARELARRGVLFTDVTAPAPWTLPSMASLLSGLMPRDHGLNRWLSGPRFPAGVSTWAEALRQAGFQTAAYTGLPWVVPGPGSLLKGFAAAKDGFGLDGAPATLQGWRRSLDEAQPFFLLLHTFEAHDPYGAENNRRGQAAPPPPPGFNPRAVTEPAELVRHFLTSRGARRALERTLGPAFLDGVVRYLWSGYKSDPRPDLAEDLRRAYVEGVRWVDGLLKETVAWLESEGLLEDTLLVVTSDHGEAFGEHGTLEHGRILHAEVLHVPLLIVGPEPFTGGRVIEAQVSLMDVMPTLAARAGVSAPPGAVGRALDAVVRGSEGGRVSLAQEFVNFDVTREDVEITLRAARSKRFAVVLEWDRRRGTLREHAYDRLADPLEARDLAEGRGSLEGLTLDPEICRAVDALRAELVAEGLTAPGLVPCGR